MDNRPRCERTEPDENLIRLTEKILDQNGEILQMNAKLLAWINAPMMLVELEKPKEKKIEKEGGSLWTQLS